MPNASASSVRTHRHARARSCVLAMSGMSVRSPLSRRVLLTSIVVAVGLVLFEGVSARSYFYLREGQTRAFVEAVAEHQVIMAAYTVSEPRRSNCRLEFRDQDQFVRFTKNVGTSAEESKGQLAYLTQKSGEHTFSVTCGQTSWWEERAKTRWSLSIDVVADTTDLLTSPALLDVPNLNSLTLAVVDAESRLEALIAENEYEKTEQDSFQQSSESALASITYLNILMFLVTSAGSYYQLVSLKTYFRQQKLIS